MGFSALYIEHRSTISRPAAPNRLIFIFSRLAMAALDQIECSYDESNSQLSDQFNDLITRLPHLK